MPSLIAKPALEGLVPVSHGGLTLSDAAPSRITSVAPFSGQEKAVTAALKKACKLGFPAPNQVLGAGGARIVWTGQGQAFLLDTDPTPLEGLAALTDQSDGWATLRLEGRGAEEVLARLVPIDLRPTVFAKGHAARTLLGHMMAVILRADDGALEVMVFRSMARTAVHEIEVAMKAVAARG
ncbi:sarcosine oxidase subunit gamma [Acidimangrovimonas pyrenivorans]|uniref:Sarcosine oxidase subunit gamma n=1 Tax=Acidimangrovimonas pyrenivorans TaxID=2030798 RepID=A0ABV7AHI7_9RHOB